jgi:hypothetical protein
MKPEDQTLLINLKESLDYLEGTIDQVEVKISNNSTISPNVLDRLKTYKEMVNKQRTFCREIEQCLENNNTYQAYQLLSKINGLSQMIRDDAVSILNETSQPTKN